MEKIVGPIHGFYVAAYAWPSADASSYSSYAKICRHQPASYWDAKCLVKLFGGEHHATVAVALATAHLLAREQIDDLPSLECSTFGLDLPYFDSRSAAAV
ncbi:MAG: hypothetical protein JWQ13_3030 [Ramlibacter sp.]|jgi:hypothetical protein|nr:hypothetical protein [Ramlibacter sp.]